MTRHRLCGHFTTRLRRHVTQRMDDDTPQNERHEALADGLHIDEPWAAYYPAGSLNNDASNWWGPNVACVLDMLRRVGFSSARFVCIWDANPIDRIRGASLDQACAKALRSGRAVFHAYV